MHVTVQTKLLGLYAVRRRKESAAASDVQLLKASLERDNLKALSEAWIEVRCAELDIKEVFQPVCEDSWKVRSRTFTDKTDSEMLKRQVSTL